ncbi:tRNA1(Val) (adenine(37)-N6)-methyltransferase [Clostridium akagii]|uniref:tRNA1(Val) (adenine(37)-N6)-methyltransferase n=1 Tax=Clostridium akagii TaxID=91623 RepID=UPI00047DA6EA|nr:tRNA1(Val) (adenine(37)-N6)-methyltransferase [Clostridium akagii]
MELVENDETLDDLQLGGVNIIQKSDAFRFGIDAVLLANFARIKKDMRVVDLCTGGGIIPFLIAGKTDAKSIVGIEIQEEMVNMADRSIKLNKLEDKIKFLHGDIKDMRLIKGLSKADVVTVNPPYKLKNSGIINPNNKNAIARHEIFCDLEDVIVATRNILKDNGRMYMVHRPERLADIFCIMRKYRIEPKSVQMIHPSAGKAPNIVLVEGHKDGGAFLKWEKPLYVHNEDGSYTSEIDKIYGRVK